MAARGATGGSVEVPRAVAASMSRFQARHISEILIEIERVRISANNRSLSGIGDDEVMPVLMAVVSRLKEIEKFADNALKAWVEQRRDARWLISLPGIGPSIAAALLANIDITKTKTPSSLWRLCDLDPTYRPLPGVKPAWNPILKVTAFRAGHQFVLSKRDSPYWPIMDTKRAQYEKLNAEGRYAERAKEVLAAGKPITPTELRAYRQGRLPQSRIFKMARRYGIKIFLSHLWAVMYEVHYGEPAPMPWAIEHGNAHELIPIPNWPIASTK